MKIYTHCSRCKVALRKRKTLPSTAVKGGDRWWDYYQCPKCKNNYANPKEKP